MDFGPLIEKIRGRLADLEREVADPALFADPRRAGEALREHARARALLDDWTQLGALRREAAESARLVHDPDPELAALAREEGCILEKQIAAVELRVREALLPPDENEGRDAIVEIRAGTGGEEAALFAAALHRMYSRYAEAHLFKVETLEASPSEAGGFKEIIFRVSGERVFRALKFESGVHRVQRVPATEAQGRIHTSTATVAVLPEAREIDIELRPEDLRIDVARSGGPGGQGVNTTDSAVQILHIPTGRIVKCQDGRSQQQNKEKALRILRARLLEERQREEDDRLAATRRRQVGTGGREEKIRTYNFPQNRVTDHRINLTLHSLDEFLEGTLDPMIEALRADDADRAQALRTQAMDAAPACPGTLNDQPFEWLADADPRLGPVCEAFIDGKYYWLPFDRVAELTIDEPDDTLDLVWIGAELALGNGGAKHVLIPTRYPGSDASEDDAIRTSRRTEWIGSDALGYRGLGQREWVTDRGETGLLDVRKVTLVGVTG